MKQINDQHPGKLIDLPNHTVSSMEITNLLFNLTGQGYTFASSSSVYWGREGEVKEMGSRFPNGFYQLMPEKSDDGFFDWYCFTRQYEQFFETKPDCVLQFTHYWMKWIALGKPKPFEEDDSNEEANH